MISERRALWYDVLAARVGHILVENGVDSPPLPPPPGPTLVCETAHALVHRQHSNGLSVTTSSTNRRAALNLGFGFPRNRARGWARTIKARESSEIITDARAENPPRPLPVGSALRLLHPHPLSSLSRISLLQLQGIVGPPIPRFVPHLIKPTIPS
ncbi:hypothetical protein VUR80DRAFT_52 [Thermomyces stellatus]